MPTKQETINFPIRKTRTASMKAGKTEEILPVRRSSRARTTKENFYDSPRRSTRATKDACDSPCRSSRRTETPTRVSRVAAKDADAGTPSKRKASISGKNAVQNHLGICFKFEISVLEWIPEVCLVNFFVYKWFLQQYYSFQRFSFKCFLTFQKLSSKT